MKRLLMCAIFIGGLWSCSDYEKLPFASESATVPATITREEGENVVEEIEVIEEFCGEMKTVLLKAGKHFNAGEITVRNSDEQLYITVTSTDLWQIGETHLHIGKTLDDFPLNKPGNPKVGKFDYKSEGEYSTVVTFTFDLEEFNFESDETILISFHAKVMESIVFDDEEEELVEVAHTESAWSEGTSFPGRSWAMYFEYQVAECDVILE